MSDLISKKALLEAIKTSGLDYDWSIASIRFEGLINSAPAVSGEAVPYGFVIDCKQEFIEDLNYEERNFFVEDKNQLSYYIGTEDEPSMYDITPLYLSPPQPQSVKDAFRLGILYASQKYEVVRNEHFTGGDVADFLFMEEGELDDSDIESEIRKLIGIK